MSNVPASHLRKPRSIVLLNGVEVKASPCVSWDHDQNTNYEADTFKMSFALAADPPSQSAEQLAYWASVTPLEVEIFAGFPQNASSYSTADLTSLIVGRADELDVDIPSNRVHLSGRDYTSEFLDNKLVEKYQNQTASEIATKLALAHGFQTSITPTSTPVGNYYTQDYVTLSADRPEWDLLTYLAQREGFACYMKGKTLHFEPQETNTGAPYIVTLTPPSLDSLTATSSASRITLKRNLTVARDVVVQIRGASYKAGVGKPFTVKANLKRVRNRNNPSIGNVPVQTYSYVMHNVDQATAQRRANELLEQISAHEVNMDGDGPADLILTQRSIINLQGTGSAFDQDFFPESVNRHFDFDGARFSMAFRAKNHSPESKVLV